jgi:hypothetical protein
MCRIVKARCKPGGLLIVSDKMKIYEISKIMLIHGLQMQLLLIDTGFWL